MKSEERFEFGKNWRAFLETVDETRIEEAQESLRQKLGRDSLGGERFLDIGCGSGLFSLAAHRLGAEVVSIDYDQECVGCTQTLRDRFGDDVQGRWTIHQGSVLDESFMLALGEFDVVYSWGVLHHTGDMNRAIELASRRVCPGGQFFIAIYNDQGGASRRWLAIKKLYHRFPSFLRPVWVVAVASVYESKFAFARLARFGNPLPFADWRAKKNDRGMTVWYDWVDWIGGLPFEVAKPEDIVMPLRKRGFTLDRLTTVGNGWGCNEYVFERVGPEAVEEVREDSLT
ncbi:Ubiquinone biosynthesis O-methyltransferase [Rubripirellula amarantea]|uniref:Ubiquinone biosynthesis O-methyltransferase n=1 Tax=Rubripirellula amarantea TaxID=2527999 RepID=A0A5C5WS02_9BACT|nr:class I SAM-dependent methyltransferase [Rubripirellula amarantea]TWT53318.1 Ubiquinone biosynthesis O-methyltransferase [Rubripirellula amarantea]